MILNTFSKYLVSIFFGSASKSDWNPSKYMEKLRIGLQNNNSAKAGCGLQYSRGHRYIVTVLHVPCIKCVVAKFLTLATEFGYFIFLDANSAERNTYIIWLLAFSKIKFTDVRHLLKKSTQQQRNRSWKLIEGQHTIWNNIHIKYEIWNCMKTQGKSAQSIFQRRNRRKTTKDYDLIQHRVTEWAVRIWGTLSCYALTAIIKNHQDTLHN